jgi:tetratricopeptide (TPR) repeat protein
MNFFNHLLGKILPGKGSVLTDQQHGQISNPEPSIANNAIFHANESELSDSEIDKKVLDTKTSDSQKSDKRTIRVFISSTFRDMIEDRNALMTHCWPELRRFCRERQVELVEVDLRWGIAEEQSTRNETLKLCLEEIKACRPYFIGLLGERYGWVPDDVAFTADLKEEQPWLNAIKGKSVTELEILHGVLNNPEMAGRAFFYFRDPAYSKNRGVDFLSESLSDGIKQTELKSQIRRICAEKNIPLYETYPDPDSMAKLVLKQLMDAIGIQFPIEEIPDLQTREAHDHEAFADTRRRTYIGRPDYIETINLNVSGKGLPLVLLGDSGSGKSALLANWVEDWRRVHPNDLIFQHYIGGAYDSSDHWKLMRRLVGFIKRWSDDPEELPVSNDDLLRDFSIWLAKARIKAEREGIRVIVILDALNKLEDKDFSHVLGWLPFEAFSDNLRLIVSTLHGVTQDLLEKRALPELHIKPLSPTERERMIHDYLKLFGKSLDEIRIKRFSMFKATENPLFLKILLDELRVTGTHDKLDERLDYYLMSEDIPSLLQKVLNRYQKDYEHDRKGLVCDVLGLIWAARRGLTETELLQLLRPCNLPQLPLATWSPLRSALDESLIDRGGVLNFAYDFLRTAVENAFVPNIEKKNAFRIQLADYFDKLPLTKRNCDELPWLLQKTQSFERLRACLLNIDSFLLIQQQNEDELLHYWVHDLDEFKIIGTSYIESFNLWEKETGLKIIHVAYVANQLSLFLLYANQYDNAEPLLRKALKIHEQYYGPDHPNISRNLYNLAHLLKSTNRLNEAEPLMHRALKIIEQNNENDISDLTIILDSLAQLLQETNRLNEAESLIRRALSINERKFGSEHPNVVKNLNSLGLLLQATNRMPEAEMHLRRALKLSEQVLGMEHPFVAYSLNNIAIMLKATNRNDEAELLFRRELTILEHSFGKNHSKLATCLSNLGSLLHQKGQLEEAYTLLQRALIIEEENLGDNHPKVAMKLNNLAMLLMDKGEFEEAESYLRKALKIAEQSYGQKHSDVATCLNGLAGVLRRTNRKQEAAQMRRKAMTIALELTRSSGFEHQYLRLYMINYVELLLEMGYSYDEVMKIIQSFGKELTDIFLDELNKLK